MKHVILITGASSGFGKLVAEKLLKTHQWIVYAGARRVENMKDLEKMGAILLHLDVTNQEDIDAAVSQIISDHGKIDALLANAGYGSYGTIENVPMEDIHYQYEVNVFGVAKCLKAVLPHMRKQKSGRIVITSSLASHLSLGGMGRYCSTKHAISAISKALRQEVAHLGIHVSAIEPGTVQTGFDDVANRNLSKVDHAPEYKTYLSQFVKISKSFYAHSPGPEYTADCIIKALTDKNPKAVYKTTKDAILVPILATILPIKWFDALYLWLVRNN